MLKHAGAVRLSQMVESITHCVHSVSSDSVSSETARLLANMPDLSPHMVSVQWLGESMKLGRQSEVFFFCEIISSQVCIDWLLLFT